MALVSLLINQLVELMAMKEWQVPELARQVLKYIGVPGLFTAVLFYEFIGPSWAAIIAIYVLGAVMVIEFSTASSFKELNFRVRVLTGIVFVAILLTFSYLIFIPAPLTISSESHLPAYPQGSNVLGIEWKDIYSELSVQIANNTPYDYT